MRALADSYLWSRSEVGAGSIQLLLQRLSVCGFHPDNVWPSWFEVLPHQPEPLSTLLKSCLWVKEAVGPRSRILMRLK